MYLDKMLEFSDGQDLTGTSSAQEVMSTDICNLGVLETNAFGVTITPDIGDAGMLIWHTMLEIAHTGGSNASLVVELVTKASAASMSSGSTVIDTFNIAQAAAKGTHYQRPVPMSTFAQYVAVLYRGATDQTDTCTVSSWIGLDRQNID
jgi:hypothetical protein